MADGFYFQTSDRKEVLIEKLIDALEAAETEPRYTMREAGLLIADKLEEQGIYSGAGYLRDNLGAAESPTPQVPMSMFHFRRAASDPTGYYYTDWNKAIPIEVVAESEVAARKQGFELSGAAPRGREWLLRLDKVAAVAR
ncbi:hypothetical protein [Cryobacterium sp. Y57]|uniref:hypothetical protein n=1 Tax=Cryobacterium sp. Y57 TaxID=2048287 RepID=UPI000CE41B0A|nr:hypothetical protein [Cryobacterium sp. Y57]